MAISSFQDGYTINYGGKTYKLIGGKWVVQSTTPTPTPTPTPTQTPVPTVDPNAPLQITPGKAVGANQINVADYSGQIATDPALALTKDDPATTDTNESMFLSDQVKPIDENAAGTNVDATAPKYEQQPSTTAEMTQATAQAAATVDPRLAQGYTSQTTQGAVAGQDMTAAQGTVSAGAQVTAPQVDIKGTATGINADGSTNYTGQALAEAATQDLSTVDSKATVKGQIAELQADFTGPNGEPKIPLWAAATARSVSKIASFRGMTGSAAVAAMAQAMMEASIPIAQQDAQFFQTLTLQNLSNKQQSTINRANVLAKMDQVNVDNRMAAAIQNSKNFLDMDLRNLDNEQQARVLNTQNRVQSIFEDAKSINAERLFFADATNQMGKFYDQLGSQVEMFNASQSNAMAEFNATESNDMTKFNTDLENQRQQFYKEMQFNIDTSNAKWRQTVTLSESEQAFEAAATDVKNLVGISVEQMNQLWDRSDALLDYLWKSTENELDRLAALKIEKLKSSTAIQQADAEGTGALIGSVVGAVASGFSDWLFG